MRNHPDIRGGRLHVRRKGYKGDLGVRMVSQWPRAVHRLEGESWVPELYRAATTTWGLRRGLQRNQRSAETQRVNSRIEITGPPSAAAQRQAQPFSSLVISSQSVPPRPLPVRSGSSEILRSLLVHPPAAMSREMPSAASHTQASSFNCLLLCPSLAGKSYRWEPDIARPQRNEHPKGSTQAAPARQQGSPRACPRPGVLWETLG